MLTILTPTYNRVQCLQKLYDSLCKQTDQEFQWLLIDDGSTDNTNGWFQELEDSKFEKMYLYKDNAGKHTAINYGIPYIKGELVLIADSDDWLTENAVEVIKNDWVKYRNNSEICGITYLRGENVTIPLGNVTFYKDKEISTSIERKINAKQCVDSCETIRLSVLKEFPFPEHSGEKFLGETYLWNLSGYKYKTVYRNHIVYVTEYLEGGLTKSGRILRINSPLGGMDNSKTYFHKEVCLKQRIKNTWLYVCYGKFAKKKARQIIGNSGQRVFTTLNYGFGVILYLYWKKKYL